METERPVPDTEGNKTDLMDRAAQLFQEGQGPKWSEIAKTLETEGFLEDGKPVSSNALRKRFYKDPRLKKLVETYRLGKSEGKEAPAFTVSKKHLDKRPAQSLGRVKRGITTDHTEDTTITAKEVLSLLQGSMQRRDEMLLEQIRKSNTGVDYLVIREIEDKMMERMTEEWKNIQDELVQIEARLEILVEDKVEENLKSMAMPGGSFEKDLESLLSRIIEKKFSGESGTLLSALTLTPSQPGGPGRWEGEGKMARFSATMPQHLYDRMKAIEGDASFSAKIAAACDVYLRVLASQNNNTEYDKEG